MIRGAVAVVAFAYVNWEGDKVEYDWDTYADRWDGDVHLYFTNSGGNLVLSVYSAGIMEELIESEIIHKDNWAAYSFVAAQDAQDNTFLSIIQGEKKE